DTVLVDTVCNSTRSNHFNIGLTKVNITCNEQNVRASSRENGCTISQSSNARCTNLLTGQCQDKLSCSIRSTGQRRRHNIRKTCNRIVNSSASNRVIKRIKQVDTDTVLVDTVCNSTRSNHFNIGLTKVNITCNERNLRRTTYRDGCTISQSSNARCTNLLTGQCQDKLSCSILSTGQRRPLHVPIPSNRIVNSSASNRVIKRIN